MPLRAAESDCECSGYAGPRHTTVACRFSLMARLWRLKECLNLHKDWIKPREQIAVLPGKNHKNRKPKIFPLDGKLWEMIRHRLEGLTLRGCCSTVTAEGSSAFAGCAKRYVSKRRSVRVISFIT